MSGKKWILVAVSLIILTTNLPIAADVLEDAKAIKISAGLEYTLILTKNKPAWGCGTNHDWQLGIGDDANDQWTLVRVHDGDMNTPSGYLEDINDIDAGWQHSLAVDVNGFAWAWGFGYFGELGNGDGGYSAHSSTPIRVLSGDQDPNNPNSHLRYIESISASQCGLYSLAVDANGFVWAWGRNMEGQLGSADSCEDCNELTPVQVYDGDMNKAIAVSAGEDTSMAADANGFVWTWGDNVHPFGAGYGQLGIGYDANLFLVDTPVQVLSGEQDTNDPNSHLKNIVAVSAGWGHFMTLEKNDPCDPNCNGRVYTWGYNGPQGYIDGGRLGDGTCEDSNTAVIVLSGEQDPNDPNSYLKDIIDISAGGHSHSLALDVNGFVWAWGDNHYGQLGNDTNDSCTTPVRVVGLDGEGYLENIVDISAGEWHSMAIDANGTIWAWGRGFWGQTGLGNTADRNTPHPIPVVYNMTQQIFYFKIQDAIDDANNSDVIKASKGTCYENIDFLDKSIIVKSTDPNDWNVVDKTTIDGSNNDSNYVVTFDDNSGSTLFGFTITGGNYGGVYCGNQSSANIKNCKIQNNTDNYGFGIALDYSSPNITNCKILNNGGYGIYCWDTSDANIADCNIEDNDDAGIYCNNSDPNITSCLITENGSENNYGGGIYDCNSSSPNITDCNISYNLASYGGGIFNDYSSPNITNCIFSGNSATATGSNSAGGGIFNLYSSPTITNCVFSGNTTTGISYYSYGGGMQNSYSSPTLKDCIFSGNSSDYYGGGMQNSYSSPTVKNCIFSGNSSDYYGGGMRNYESSPTVKNCIFSGNSAYYGGGMQDHNESSPTVTGCTFSGNSAYYGGGMHNDVNSDPNVNNCILWGNNAVDDGNEIYNYDANYSVPNVTYSDVQGSWAGQGNINSDPCFVNIFAFTDRTIDSNTTTTIAVTYANIYDIDDVIEYNNDGVARTVTNVNTDANIVTFANALDANSEANKIVYNWGPNITDVSEDFHIDWYSLCIDTGDPNYTPDPNETDIDGEDRVMDGTGDSNDIIDMGADEVDYPECWDCNEWWNYGDVNGDGYVNATDVGPIINHLGERAYVHPCADLNKDGWINANDVGIIINNLGKGNGVACP